MIQKGDCWDNTLVESFFHTLNVELIHGILYNTRQEAKTAIFEYVEDFIPDSVVILISATSAR
jgi:putative transposase